MKFIIATQTILLFFSTCPNITFMMTEQVRIKHTVCVRGKQIISKAHQRFGCETSHKGTINVKSDVLTSFSLHYIAHLSERTGHRKSRQY